MVRFYASRIDYDLTRINEVPVRWREDVRQYIIEHPEGA